MNIPDKDAPIYNLKAVVQETNLKPDTLRAWERRYGIPKPKRTPSGHRLYSVRDVEMLHWLIKRQEEGLSISRAIELWQHAQEETNALEQENSKANAASRNHFAQREQNDIRLRDPVSALREQWIDACLQYDQPLADQILAQAFAMFSTETVCIELLQHGLARIGEGWYEGNITVQQEHFASTIVMRRLETLLSSLPPATRSGRILICNPQDEEHTFAPLMLSLLLRRRGLDVINLGANVPIASLDSTLALVKPNLVILTAQQIYTAATLLEMGQFLLSERIPMAYGGHIFHQLPDLQNVIPGHYLGDKIEEALQRVEQLMMAPRTKGSQRLIPQEYQEAYKHFREHQVQIEADVWKHVNGHALTSQQLSIANAQISRTIASALILGSMDYMEESIAWIKGLLLHHLEMPASTLESYLHKYYEAACNNLDARGTVIVEGFVREGEIGRQENRETGKQGNR